jgi:hypothetical protein
MSRKRQRLSNFDDTLTKIFIVMLLVAASVGILSQTLGSVH